MTLLNYMMTIKHLIGEFALEEDHKQKLMIVRSAKPLSDDQKEEVSRLSPLPPRYIVKGSV